MKTPNTAPQKAIGITPSMFLKAAGIYLVLFLLPGIPIAFFAKDLEALPENTAFSIFAIAFVLLTAYVIFLLDIIAKRIFVFRGIGNTISITQLRERILHINQETSCPVTVVEKGQKLLVTWKYLDATWWELIRKAGTTESFSILLRFDEKHHRVTLTEIKKSITWGVGPGDLRFGFSFFRGIDLNFSMGAGWGIRENFTLGQIYNYHFTSRELREPLLAVILSAGWDVSFGLF